MKIYGHQHDPQTCSVFSTLPSHLRYGILQTLQLLDCEYGSHRDVFSDLGGYVILMESPNDFIALQKEHHIDIDHSVFEYIDTLDDYLYALALMMSDFAITVIIPTAFAPKSLLSQV